MAFDLAEKRVWIAGHEGMVGSALVRRLAHEPCEVLTSPRDEVDFRDGHQVRLWLQTARPDAVILSAGRVGGIVGNDSYPASFIYDNLAIATNVIHQCARAGVGRLLYLGSSCIYPKFPPLPIREDALLTGPLEPTNEWYALAKIAGVKMCLAYRRQYGLDYVAAMPTNLVGPNDNFHPTDGHVIPGLIQRFVAARDQGLPEATVWGTGKAMREFMHVDDVADAIVCILKGYSEDEHINMGSGIEITIADLARLVADEVGFTGRLVQDASRPDGTPRKLLDSSKLAALGWKPTMTLRDCIRDSYAYYRTLSP